MSQRYYHVTSKDRLKSIKANGIQTGRKRRWSNRFGAKLGHTNRVYLSADFHDAVRWAGKMRWDLGPGQDKPIPDIIILCLADVPGRIEPDEFGGVFSNSFYQCAESVPAHCIEKMVPVTETLMQQLVAANRTGERITEPTA